MKKNNDKDRVYQNEGTRVGNLSELLVATELVKRGIPVLTPLTEAMLPYDALAQINPTTFARIQVRTAKFEASGSWTCPVHRDQRTRNYDKSETDFVVAVILIKDKYIYYVVPVQHLAYCKGVLTFKPGKAVTSKLSLEQFEGRWDLIQNFPQEYQYPLKYEAGPNNEVLMNFLN